MSSIWVQNFLPSICTGERIRTDIFLELSGRADRFASSNSPISFLCPGTFRILTMQIQCSFFVRLHLLLHFVGLSASPFAGLDARRPHRLLSWMSLQHLPFSFLEHDSCGIPTFPGLLALTSWSDHSSSPAPPTPPLFRTQAFRCDRTPGRLPSPRAPPVGTDVPGGRRLGQVA